MTLAPLQLATPIPPPGTPIATVGVNLPYTSVGANDVMLVGGRTGYMVATVSVRETGEAWDS